MIKWMDSAKNILEKSFVLSRTNRLRCDKLLQRLQVGKSSFHSFYILCNKRADQVMMFCTDRWIWHNLVRSFVLHMSSSKKLIIFVTESFRRAEFLHSRSGAIFSQFIPCCAAGIDALTLNLQPVGGAGIRKAQLEDWFNNQIWSSYV